AEDTEEFGGHVGDCNAFTVEIRQTQDRFVGEGDLVALQGTIAGGKVNASFVQEHLDITGEFAWTVGDGGDSLDGTFTSHLSDGGSNSGESTVERLDVAPTSTEPC
ncbi:MAG: hypothetical protein Q8S13_00075, partial [Dehalococcoidia bacterium]|nr:hypothetical protein [Dehalococcoidia bacterium]